jgi:hypothetical protein
VGVDGGWVEGGVDGRCGGRVGTGGGGWTCEGKEARVGMCEEGSGGAKSASLRKNKCRL